MQAPLGHSCVGNVSYVRDVAGAAAWSPPQLGPIPGSKARAAAGSLPTGAFKRASQAEAQRKETGGSRSRAVSARGCRDRCHSHVRPRPQGLYKRWISALPLLAAASRSSQATPLSIPCFFHPSCGPPVLGCVGRGVGKPWTTWAAAFTSATPQRGPGRGAALLLSPPLRRHLCLPMAPSRAI